MLASNIFVGFKRIVFSEEFINTTVKKLWEDTRDKIKNHKLIDVVQKSKNGSIVFLKNGEISTAPNFLTNGNEIGENITIIKRKPRYIFMIEKNNDISIPDCKIVFR